MIHPIPKPGPRVKTPKPLRAGKAPSQRNEVRKARTHEEDFSGGINHHRYIQLMDCCVCKLIRKRQTSPTQAAHAKTRATGGKWYEIIPLCNDCHREQESIGNHGIREVYGIDLPALARRLTRQHLEEIGAI